MNSYESLGSMFRKFIVAYFCIRQLTKFRQFFSKLSGKVEFLHECFLSFHETCYRNLLNGKFHDTALTSAILIFMEKKSFHFSLI